MYVIYVKVWSKVKLGEVLLLCDRFWCQPNSIVRFEYFNKLIPVFLKYID